MLEGRGWWEGRKGRRGLKRTEGDLREDGRRWKEGEKDQRAGISRLKAAGGLVNLCARGVTVGSEARKNLQRECETDTACLRLRIDTFLGPPLLSGTQPPPTWSLWRLEAQLHVCQTVTVRRWRFPCLSCLTWRHGILKQIKQDGGLFCVLARCYYIKLIYVCYCVIVPLQ